MATPTKRHPEKRMGRPPKLGDHKLFSLRLPTELHRALKTYATVQGKSVNDILTDVIASWWREQPERARIESLVGATRKGA
jgi:NRPS condensation-like uncharacterized protein